MPVTFDAGSLIGGIVAMTASIVTAGAYTQRRRENRQSATLEDVRTDLKSDISGLRGDVRQFSSDLVGVRERLSYLEGGNSPDSPGRRKTDLRRL